MNNISTKYSIYLFGVLHHFQHCTGHITTDSWKGRGNQYIQFVKVLYCKLLTNGKQLPAFPFEAVLGTEPRPQRWEARVLPLCHRGPPKYSKCNSFQVTSDLFNSENLNVAIAQLCNVLQACNLTIFIL